MKRDFFGRIINLSSFIVKVTEVFKFLRVHENVREEHLLLSLFVQKSVIHCAYSHFRAEVAQELNSLKDELVIVRKIALLDQATSIIYYRIE